jgi:type I restriction enzyme, S subunit
MSNDLPSGWEWATVGSVAESLVDGPFGSKLKTEHYQSSGIRVVRLQNISDGQFEDTDKAYVAEEHAKLLSRHDARPGDVLIAAMGEVLPRACLFPPHIDWAIVKADCFRLRPRSGILPEYLAYILAAPQTRKQAAPEIAGVGRPRLNLRKVAALRIPVPPHAEQRRLVDAIDEQFSCLDTGLAALSRAYLGVRRLKADALSLGGGEADSWVTLGEIAEVIGGVTKDAKKQADPSFTEVAYLRVANVQRGYLDLAKVATIRVPAATAHRLRLEPGDILFNEGGDRDKLGRGWIWEGQIPGCIHQNHVFRARLLNDDYDSRFISMHGNSFGRSWFDKNGKQTTNLASLSLTTLKSFPVPKISVDEQRAMVSSAEQRLSALDAVEGAIRAAEKRCHRLRAAVLKAAFSGTLA